MHSAFVYDSIRTEYALYYGTRVYIGTVRTSFRGSPRTTRVFLICQTFHRALMFNEIS